MSDATVTPTYHLHWFPFTKKQEHRNLDDSMDCRQWQFHHVPFTACLSPRLEDELAAFCNR